MISLTLLAAMVACSSADGPVNPLQQQLIDPGFTVVGTATAKLAPPFLPDGLDAAGERKALDRAAGKIDLSLFMRKTLTAPFSLVTDSDDEPANKRRIQRIDLAFVAVGKVETFARKDFGSDLLATGSKTADDDKTVFLDAAALAKRKIVVEKGKAMEERFATGDFELLDKVRITGVSRQFMTETPTSMVMATLFDPRFGNDADFPNRFQLIDKTKEGAEKYGPPLPYAGMGGYVKVTQLQSQPDCILIELHYAFHEPYVWFDGNNVLRSKFPTVIQDNVRKMRRKLQKN